MKEFMQMIQQLLESKDDLAQQNLLACMLADDTKGAARQAAHIECTRELHTQIIAIYRRLQDG